VLFILVPLGLQALGIDLESLIILAIFVGGTRLIQRRAALGPVPSEEVAASRHLPLLWAGLGFAGGVAVLVLAAPSLVGSAEAIAATTGLGTGFIGLALLPLVTGMPELVSSITALRIGAFDLAVGNLFGSCVFNTFALALAGLLFQPGSIYAAISSGFSFVGLLGLILINIALLGTLARPERRIRRIEWDAILIIVVYVAGIYLLYQRAPLLSAQR